MNTWWRSSCKQIVEIDSDVKGMNEKLNASQKTKYNLKE